MSKRDDKVSLFDMLSHAREAVALLGGRSQPEFNADRTTQLALTRLVEIVGEAANRVTPETRERYVQIPWGQIVDTRNRLIHGYDVIDLDILWSTITIDLPRLIERLEETSD